MIVEGEGEAMNSTHSETKPALKKYDRRSITSAENGRRAWGLNIEAQVAELEDKIRELADSTDDERLRFEALKYLCDRLGGKPYVATNPAERKAPRTDNRVQMAIETLILGRDPAKVAKRLGVPPNLKMGGAETLIPGKDAPVELEGAADREPHLPSANESHATDQQADQIALEMRERSRRLV